MAGAQSLRVPFTLRGISGLISVSVTRNTDPDAVLTRHVQAVAGPGRWPRAAGWGWLR